MWKVYMLICADNSLYTGITTDIKRRLDEHNWIWYGGAKYTKIRQPVELVYLANVENRSEAAKEEIRIKQMTRKQKLELIESSTNIYKI